MRKTSVSKSVLNRILSICLILAMLLSFVPASQLTANAAGTKMLYLDASSLTWWGDANAITTAWVWKEGGNGAWYDMSLVNGIYQAEIPSDANKVIFGRVNPAFNDNRWNGFWARSKGDMSIDGNCYKVTSTYDDNGTTYTNGSWSTYTPPADVYSLAGTMNSWITTANIMNATGDGKVSIEVALTAGQYEFKVVKAVGTDQTWIGYEADETNAGMAQITKSDSVTVSKNTDSTNSYNNIILNVTYDGDYIFTYDPSGNTLEIIQSCTHSSHNNDEAGTCTSCGAAVGHTYVDGTYVQPTCTAAGYTPYTCSVCGRTGQSAGEPALGHDYDENGECTRCDAALEMMTIYLKPEAAYWDQYGAIFKVTVDGNSTEYSMTLFEDGVYQVKIPSESTKIHFYRYSADGSDRWNEAGEMDIEGNCYTITGWNDSGDWSTYTPCTHPSHNQDGTCTNPDCGATVEHKYVQDSIKTKPTCTEKGVAIYKCSCGKTEEREIAALGHKYEDGKCTVCGAEYTCNHLYHNVMGVCTECRETVGHDASYESTGVCNVCNAKKGYYVVYFDATLSKLRYEGNSNSMPHADADWIKVYWKGNNNTSGTETMTQLEPVVRNGHTYSDVWMAYVPESATTVRFYSGADSQKGWGSCRTDDLPIQTNNNCFYADSSDKSIYINQDKDDGLRGGYWGEPFNVRNPQYFDSNKDSVDIPTGNYEEAKNNANNKNNTMYVGTTFYDYFTDFELNGGNRDNYGSWVELSHQSWVPFRHFNQALSDYYKEANVRVPIYTGHFQPVWDKWERAFEEVAGTLNLYGYKDGLAYGSNGNKDQKWFMSVNNSNMNLTPSLGYVNSAAQGIVDSSLADGNLMSSGVQLPYFNEAFLTGSNSKNTIIGEIYKNVQFPFTSKDLHGDGIQYWVFDSSDSNTILQMYQDQTDSTYFLDYVTGDKYKNLNASSNTNGVSNTYGFFPFNDGATANNANTYNYGFGVRMDLPFDLTEDGTKQDKDGNYKDIVFDFAGDDDLWIFIDGELVLDVGGSHGRVEGTINFATGEATVSRVKSSGGSDTEGYNVVKKFNLKGSRSGEHTLSLFYMERGMWESNLKVSFNFTPKDVTLSETTSVTVTKEWNLQEDSSAYTQESVQVQLQRKAADSSDWQNVGEPVTLSSGNWTRKFEGADILRYANEKENVLYEYRVVELDGDHPLNNGEKTNAGLVVTYNNYGDSASGFGVTITNHEIDSQEIVIDFGLPVDITIAGVGTTPDGELAGIGNPKLVSTGVSLTMNSKLGDSYKGTYGIAQIVDGKLRYTPKSMNMDAPELISYAVEYKDGNTTRYYHSTVMIIPAANMYFDDYFLSFKDSTAATDSVGKWNAVTDSGESIQNQNTQDQDIQDQDRPGMGQDTSIDANDVYGFVSTYGAFNKYSLGSSSCVVVDSATGKVSNAPRATFTFTGTGFDVIGVTSNNSGAMWVEVSQGGKTVKSYIVNNYYSEGTLYQVPVIKVDGLPYGKYDVTIRAIYTKLMDTENVGSYEVWVDAIRIYNPANNNVTAQTSYENDGEHNAHYTLVKDLLVNPGDFGDTLGADGVVYIDANDDNKVTIEEYENLGPNNETYLKNGNGIAFKLRYTHGVPDVMSVKLQIGAKLACGATAELWYNGSKVATINTATNMFYMLGDVTLSLNETTGYYESAPIVLLCKTSDPSAILSLTDIKVTGDSAGYIGTMDNGEGITLMAIVDEDVPEYAQIAFDAANAPEEEETPDVPGGDVPETPDDGNDVTEPGDDVTEDPDDEPGDDVPEIPDDGNDVTEPGDDETEPGDDETEPSNDATGTPDDDSADEGDDAETQPDSGSPGTYDLDGMVMLMTALLAAAAAMAVLVLDASKKKRY